MHHGVQPGGVDTLRQLVQSTAQLALKLHQASLGAIDLDQEQRPQHLQHFAQGLAFVDAGVDRRGHEVKRGSGIALEHVGYHCNDAVQAVICTGKEMRRNTRATRAGLKGL